jgi:hypothetical protein
MANLMLMAAFEVQRPTRHLRPGESQLSFVECRLVLLACIPFITRSANPPVVRPWTEESDIAVITPVRSNEQQSTQRVEDE